MSQLHGKQIRDNSTSLSKLDGTGIIEFTNATMSFTTDAVLTRTTDGITSDIDIVNKEYVDSVAAGLDPKESVRFSTKIDISSSYTSANNGTFTGVDFTSTTLFDLGSWVATVGDRVLVKNQSNLNENGIYIILTAGETGEMTRAEDADGTPSHEVSLGNFTFVEFGDNKGGTGWVLSTTDATDPDEINVGTDTQVWVQFSSQGTIVAGDGLTKDGNELNVGAGTGLTVSSTQISLEDTLVTPDSYGQANSVSTFTVDQQGRLTDAGTVSIAIISDQVTDFDDASEDAIFTTDNFVDSDTVDFTVTVGESVSADVKIDGVTASGLTVSSNGISVNVDGSTIIINNDGELEATTAVPDVSNGLSIDSVTEDIVLGGTLSQNTTINADGNDFTIGGAENITLTASVFDLQTDGLISIDSGTGSVQILSDDTVTISGSSSSNIITNGELTLSFNEGSVTDTSGDGFGLVYTDDYTGTFVTNSLITKAYVDAQLLSSGTITEVNGGDGMIGGGTGGSITLDVVGGTGISVNPDDIEVDFDVVADLIAGEGLTANNGQLDVDLDNITESIAGDGLTANNGVLDILLDGDALEFNVGNEISLKSSITGDRTFEDSVTIGGNLIVTGTTSYFATEEVLVDDNIITLNANLATASAPFAGESGIKVERGTEDEYARLTWNESLDLWTAGLSGSQTPILLYAGTGLTANGATVSIDTQDLVEGIAGDGLTANGGTLSVVGGTGIGVDTTVYIESTGVTAGFYGTADSVSTFTVNEQGQLTEAGTVSIAITSDQVTDFDSAALDAVIDETVFIDSDSIEFDVVAGSTVSANVILDSGTSSALQITGDGLSVLYDNDTIVLNNDGELTVDLGNLGAVDEIIAGTGLIGGGSSSVVELEVDFDEVANQLAGEGLSDNSGVLDVNTGLGLTISSDDVVIEWGGTATGLTFSGNAISVNVDGDTIVVNNDGELEIGDISGLKAEPVYQLGTSNNQTPPNVDEFETGITLSDTPSQYSRINVFVNGQQQRISFGDKTGDCYFSADGGTTARELVDIITTDQLIWNGLVAGFRISDDDRVEIIYEA